MSRLIYFSYGSNMSSLRIRHRIPSAPPASAAKLEQHRLKFHKIGRDGSAKCDIEYTRQAADLVYGVAFDLSATEKAILDRHEGLGKGYEQKRVSILLPGGTRLDAVTYYATSIDASLLPYHWYKEHVLRGAREHGLPGDYIASIESVASIPDPDQDIHERELSIYDDSI